MMFQGASELHRTAAGTANGSRGTWTRRAVNLKDRDCEMKFRAAANLAVDPNPAPVDLHDVLGDRKAKPGATELAGAGGVNTVKPFENRSEEHTSELQSQLNLVWRLLLEKKK